MKDGWSEGQPAKSDSKSSITAHVTNKIPLPASLIAASPLQNQTTS